MGRSDIQLPKDCWGMTPEERRAWARSVVERTRVAYEAEDVEEAG